MLAPGGLGLVLTYHSGEDRIVKDTMRRAVHGAEGEDCRIDLDAPGPQKIECSVPGADLPGVADALVAQGDAVNLFGNADLRVSTSDPDPLAQLLNSEACQVVDE